MCGTRQRRHVTDDQRVVAEQGIPLFGEAGRTRIVRNRALEDAGVTNIALNVCATDAREMIAENVGTAVVLVAIPVTNGIRYYPCL